MRRRRLRERKEGWYWKDAGGREKRRMLRKKMVGERKGRYRENSEKRREE